MLWDAKSGELAKKSWDDETLVDVAFTPDGKQLVAGGERLALYSTKSLERQAGIKDVRAPFAVFSDGRAAWVRGPGNTLVVVDLAACPRRYAELIPLYSRGGRTTTGGTAGALPGPRTENRARVGLAAMSCCTTWLRAGIEEAAAASPRGSVSLVRFSHGRKIVSDHMQQVPDGGLVR